jgi:hypothetical protein
MWEKYEYQGTRLIRSLLKHDNHWQPSIYYYNSDGKLESMIALRSEDTTDVKNKIYFSYDDLSRFCEAKHYWSDGSYEFKDSVAYNELGLLSEIFLTGPSVSRNHVINSYNAQNLLETVTNIDYYDKKDEYREYTYNEFGKIETVTVLCQRHFHDNKLLFLLDENYLNTSENVRQFFWYP